MYTVLASASPSNTEAANLLQKSLARSLRKVLAHWLEPGVNVRAQCGLQITGVQRTAREVLLQFSVRRKGFVAAVCVWSRHREAVIVAVDDVLRPVQHGVVERHAFRAVRLYSVRSYAQGGRERDREEAAGVRMRKNLQCEILDIVLYSPS